MTLKPLIRWSSWCHMPTGGLPRGPGFAFLVAALWIGFFKIGSSGVTWME